MRCKFAPFCCRVGSEAKAFVIVAQKSTNSYRYHFDVSVYHLVWVRLTSAIGVHSSGTGVADEFYAAESGIRERAVLRLQGRVR